jgi:endonuclease I
MKKYFFTLILLVIASRPIWAGTVPPDSTIFPGLKGKQLIDSLRAHFKTSTCLSYNTARDKLYGEIDITADSLTCVYSGWTIHGGPTAAPRTWAGDNDINCEHTWCQMRLSSQSPDPTCDMNHIYGTEMQVNSDRNNSPFGEVDDNNSSVYWSRNNVRTQTKPGSNIDEWAEALLNTLFEPREIHKGQTARAMYYMLTMYQLADTLADSTWWQSQKDILYSWHCQHIATAREISRIHQIAAYQQNKPNPFVLDSTLIRRAYFPALGVEGGPDGREPIEGVRLYSNHPNPFSSSTSISFILPAEASTDFSVYDVSGRRVYGWTKNLKAGEHTLSWSGQNNKGQALPNGVYLLRLQAGGRPAGTGRMVLIR